MNFFNKKKTKKSEEKVESNESANAGFDVDSYKIKGASAINIETEAFSGDNAFAQAKFYKGLLIAIFIVQLFSYQTASTLKDTERTNLVPLVGQSMTIGNDYVDDAYLINIFTFVNANYVSATPASARLQHALLLPLVHPSQYAEMQKRMDIRANTLKNLSSTALFASIDWGRSFSNKEVREHNYVGVYSKLWKTEFNTTRLLFVTGKEPETKNIKVELFYTVENGRFWIVDIIEVF